MSEKLVRIKNRIDTDTNWISSNPILALGEIGIDRSNRTIRVGDGSSNWKNLVPYVGNCMTQKTYKVLTNANASTLSGTFFNLTYCGYNDNSCDAVTYGGMQFTIIVTLPGYLPMIYYKDINNEDISNEYTISLPAYPTSNGNITVDDLENLNIILSLDVTRFKYEIVLNNNLGVISDSKYIGGNIYIEATLAN